MREPQNIRELEGLFHRLIDEGFYEPELDHEMLRLAAQEVARAMIGELVGDSTLSPCQRLVAALLLRAVDEELQAEPEENQGVTS